MTLKIQGRFLLQHCLDGMYAVCERIIVVGGHKIEALQPVLAGYKKVQLVYNSEYLEGMYSSVKKGLAFLRGERFFLIPGDYPAVSQAVYRRLLTATGDIVVPTWAGRTGHPVLIRTRLGEEIRQSETHSSLRDFIAYKGYEAVAVADEGIVMDVDTAEDYNRINIVLAQRQCAVSQGEQE